MLEGLENCSPRNEKEERWAGRLQFDDSVRLACQTRIAGDVTVRRLVLDAADHEREMATFAEMNPGPVLQVHTDGGILLANPVARTLFHEGDLVGGNWLDLCPEMNPTLCHHVLDQDLLYAHEVSIDRSVFLFNHRPGSPFVFVYGTDLTNQKEAERSVAQSQKMATLGTLAAGIAHELNNPAAAAQRSADHLGQAFKRLEARFLELNRLDLSSEQWDVILRIDQDMRVAAEIRRDLDPVSRSDLEAELEDRLEIHQVEEPWELAPVLVDMGIDDARLKQLADDLPSGTFKPVLGWQCQIYAVYKLISEIGLAAGRIATIVGAVKDYSYLGEAPVQQIDVHDGLDSTLIIVGSKLSEGIVVTRNYDEGLPPIQAFGSELNQVWTNIIDNAASATGGQGRLTIRTRTDDKSVVVEIEDDGPGIPEEIQPRIFDAFFTTKPPGSGVGLGLNTTYGIVVDKHNGSIEVQSEPKKTVFSVRLPINFEQAHKPGSDAPASLGTTEESKSAPSAAREIPRSAEA